MTASCPRQTKPPGGGGDQAVSHQHRVSYGSGHGALDSRNESDGPMIAGHVPGCSASSDSARQCAQLGLGSTCRADLRRIEDAAHGLRWLEVVQGQRFDLSRSLVPQLPLALLDADSRDERSDA